eukprot:COSAG06_NODE_485_length_15117_cov_5.922493_2_plen_94_part_00
MPGATVDRFSSEAAGNCLNMFDCMPAGSLHSPERISPPARVEEIVRLMPSWLPPLHRPGKSTLQTTLVKDRLDTSRPGLSDKNDRPRPDGQRH